MVIAVDGPAAAGKGTLAKALAARLGFAHLDTGSLYRAVAAKLLALGQGPEADDARLVAESLAAEDLTARDLRSEAVAKLSSVVAAMPEVRAALLAYQRRFAAQPPGGKPGAVLDGRDVGTVVCPDAQAKLYVTASLAARARRRHAELLARGERPDAEAVRAEMEARDRRDSDRAAAPLKPAADALLLDTSDLSIEAALSAAWEMVVGRIGPRS
ncbi:MAG: (d)CMP kinase [Alphaproteobacteria bacterium]|nr:(d)CMP kinase [Alphaproteobacteria bacterium]